MYNDNSAKLVPLGACGGKTTQNSLPLFEKSCAKRTTVLYKQNNKVKSKMRKFKIFVYTWRKKLILKITKLLLKKGIFSDFLVKKREIV